MHREDSASCVASPLPHTLSETVSEEDVTTHHMWVHFRVGVSAGSGGFCLPSSLGVSPVGTGIAFQHLPSFCTPTCELHQQGALTEHLLGTSLVAGCKGVLDSKVVS